MMINISWIRWHIYNFVVCKYNDNKQSESESIFSKANYSTCFSNMPILRVTEKEKKCACFNYLHLFVPTNNETVNLVLLQKHVYYYC